MDRLPSAALVVLGSSPPNLAARRRRWRAAGAETGSPERSRGRVQRRPVERRNGWKVADRRSVPDLLVLVNAHAERRRRPHADGQRPRRGARGRGASAISAVTSTEQELWDCWRAAAACGYRAGARRPGRLAACRGERPSATPPELLRSYRPGGPTTSPARWNPVGPRGRAAHGGLAPARPLDALLVRTPERSLYALEAVSVGFQAEARARYSSENSADLRQGARALSAHAPLQAVRHSRPRGRFRARLERGRAVLLSNLRYFGYGFDVAPDADPGDGRLDAILLDAPGRLSLLRLLAATRRGRHLTCAGVRRRSGRCAELPNHFHSLPMRSRSARRRRP